MKCPKCQSEVILTEEFDAFFCHQCDEWLEEKCNDSECSFCPERPEKPSEVETKFDPEYLAAFTPPSKLSELAKDYKSKIGSIPIGERPGFKKKYVNLAQDLGYTVTQFWQEIEKP